MEQRDPKGDADHHPGPVPVGQARGTTGHPNCPGKRDASRCAVKEALQKYRGNVANPDRVVDPNDRTPTNTAAVEATSVIQNASADGSDTMGGMKCAFSQRRTHPNYNSATR
jgi:hypothetical protein